MTPKIIRVEPKADYKLFIYFKGKGKRLFDVKPYLQRGIFKELKSNRYFKKVRVVWGGVEWPHEQDLSAATLYKLSVAIRASRPKILRKNPKAS